MRSGAASEFDAHVDSNEDALWSPESSIHQRGSCALAGVACAAPNLFKGQIILPTLVRGIVHVSNSKFNYFLHNSTQMVPISRNYRSLDRVACAHFN